ncbi:phage tail sheath family protein [Foetidibacter luteolus]|uniref:phage tail sheath family protein n=1 Tax=Foetidibacter luteolus TaxID=2608880 RepID=UPI00129B5EDB|nr:phage tail sheath subtilisin-like domain-containing protein [Foetidibacter luteolus]
MATNFIHGVETIEIDNGLVAVNEVKTAVVGLVGIAPKGDKNKIVLVRNTQDAAQFGIQVPGFNIPQSLAHILAQGNGAILVVNVFDNVAHTTAVAAESKTVADGKLKLASAPIGPVTLSKPDDSPSDFVLNTDYTLDDFGNFQVIKGRIANGTVIKFAYKKLNAAAITEAVINGTVAGNGARTGLKCYDLAFNQFGYNAKIFIAPGYSAIAAVAAEMLVAANKFRGVAVLDSTYGMSVSDAIAARGGASSSNFNTADERAILLYPYLKAYDEATGSDQVDFPYSAFYAGVMAATDREFGYWFSPSNKPIRGITGVEKQISASLNDDTADTNILNAAGITTVFNSFGTGFLAWGNRNASFPVNTTPKNFISMRRIADVIHESLEQACMQFSDRPINMALIDDIRQTGNNFIGILVGRGALIEGSRVVFKKANNPDPDLANGHVKFDIEFMGATPAERITFLSRLDISLYSNLR